MRLGNVEHVRFGNVELFGSGMSVVELLLTLSGVTLPDVKPPT